MLILASASPRRNELLDMVGLKHICIPSHIDEVIPDGCEICNIPVELSYQKASDVFASHPDDVVIGADTIVEIDGKVLGKPIDANDAKRMLRLLSGRVNTVYSGVTIMCGKKTDSFYKASKVKFYELTDKEIDDYIATGDPFDKAGAYGIQGCGAVLIEYIEGDYFNIMGLPIAETARRYRRMIGE